MKGRHKVKFEDLPAELQERARACETPEDILALAKEEGYELSEQELDAIGAGDGFWDRDPNSNPRCPLHCPHV